jgi:Fe-S-cluster-containing dehydrogenase component
MAYIDYNGEGIITQVRCRHCKDAPCIKVCPTNARTRTEYGVVLFDFTKCTGCQACINACPYSANVWDDVRKIPEKCTLCAHRIVKGESPTCVGACPVKAITFGPYNDVVAKANDLVAKLNLKAEGIGTNNVIILRR